MPTSIMSTSSSIIPHLSPPITYCSFSSSSTLRGISLSFFPRNPSLKTPLSMNKRTNLSVRSAVAIEKETPQDERPDTFLRESDGPSSSVRARFEKMIRDAQDDVCTAIEAVDGGGKFKEDVWSRAGGGGGISRVLQDGGVWEKAGVNVSVVYGMMPPEAYRAARGENAVEKPGPVPFFAAGISSVLHPKNPFAPTLHFNYRYFETDAPKDAPGAPRQWWFGGGTDLTPAYIFEEDVKHFHTHRGERRGLGGIFFDDLNDYDQEMLLAFASECANSVVSAYLPIIERRKDMPFTDRHKAWQQLRRGRYVEFNLVYDRGTTFGLKTGGRIESILVSLPLTARWEYDNKPEEGSEEWKLLDACINPKEWI
ncbi:oxygen-dependent coproporphyrinogen-III oxidase, chloroplastic-like isoform X2 [Telopea speciosissima]|uniref:oxygen-dependent coproporphyrinogen-III oxidase, chloroplastic-like isoform X2 n=1 Tax=Telopea speciosissima TaxID=54955 RepID=UPI001CC7A0C0|nr:oxygen-dependent coproporphyrinogen-III oxidase, chloroplastic-like isoform X2 [Telopea speciosissima]